MLMINATINQEKLKSHILDLAKSKDIDINTIQFKISGSEIDVIYDDAIIGNISIIDFLDITTTPSRGGKHERN